MSVLKKCAGALLSLAALLAPTVASAWWNDDWAFRKEIGLDLSATGANVSGDATDVPVLLRLSLANFEFFGDAKPDGADFRVIAEDDRTPLEFHLEHFDATAQMAFLWVRVPKVSGGSNAGKIYLYYGNPQATAAASPANTYDRSQALVYHLNAPPDQPQDATSYRSEPDAYQAEHHGASLIAGGARFNGSAVITVPAGAALQLVPEQGATFSAWVRIEQPQTQAAVIALGDGTSSLVLGIEGQKAFASLSGAVVARQIQDGELTLGDWHHLALTIGAGELRLVVDGVISGSAVPVAAIPAIAGTLTLGGAGGGQGFFTGELDEVQVAGAPRSPEWLRLAALSQGMVAPLVVYGADAQKEAQAEGGYLATTLRNVTVDGWVVIVICVLMLIGSLVIMLMKLRFLNRVVAGNQRLVDELRKVGGDPTALAAAPDGTEDSTLLKLQEQGMAEVRQRLAGQAAGAARAQVLSAQSIEAIRATMDATLVRATQKLSANMVWLTISIAGGPFLGLLGTVIGVMITFAAIAQAGDVNVNAIAPGTAAALAATVAGLGVAIPCLFGYNYLNTRIKEIVADMRVFVDEFVTRVAESYS